METKEATKAYKDPHGLKTTQQRREFAFLAGARILQGAGLALILSAASAHGSVQVMQAIGCIVVYMLGSYFELIYNESGGRE
jgi:hypothetical protein